MNIAEQLQIKEIMKNLKIGDVFKVNNTYLLFVGINGLIPKVNLGFYTYMKEPELIDGFLSISKNLVYYGIEDYVTVMKNGSKRIKTLPIEENIPLVLVQTYEVYLQFLELVDNARVGSVLEMPSHGDLLFVIEVSEYGCKYINLPEQDVNVYKQLEEETNLVKGALEWSAILKFELKLIDKGNEEKAKRTINKLRLLGII